MAGKTQIPAWCDLNRNLTLFQDISRIKVAIKGHKSYKLQVCVDHLIWKDPSGSVHLCAYISYISIYICIYLYIYIYYDINGSYCSIFWRILKLGWWLLCKYCRSLVQPRFNLQKSQWLPAEYGRFVLETYPHVFFGKPRLVALFFQDVQASQSTIQSLISPWP